MTIAPEARTCAAELNVKDLAIGHNGKTLLKHLTFSVPAGSSLAIVGESGCGKSTLLTTLAGLLPALGGELSWRDAKGSTIKHPNSSFVWQQLGLLPWKTVQKNLTLPLLLSQHKIPASDCADRAAAMIEELGLSGLENRWPATLSGGQRQRLALGRALIAQPAVLFM
ncbi:ATP-binding cassette domain-containing protein, partial [Sutterella wadsworthensis]